MKQLSKEEMKMVMGGVAQACSMTYQDSSGGWHTEQGSCSIGTYNGPGGTTFYVPYCSTASFTGPSDLSSNGGVSKCGSAWGI